MDVNDAIEDICSKVKPENRPQCKNLLKKIAEGETKNLTDARFEIIIHMLNEDPKLAERLKVYLCG